MHCFHWHLLNAFSQLLLLDWVFPKDLALKPDEEFKSYLANELEMSVPRVLWGEEAHCWHREGYTLDTGKLSASEPTKLGNGNNGSTWLVKTSFLTNPTTVQQHEFALKVVKMNPKEDYLHSRPKFEDCVRSESSNKFCDTPYELSRYKWRRDAIVMELMAQRAIAPDDPRFTPAYMQCYTANHVYLMLTRHRFVFTTLIDLGVNLTFPELCTAAAQMSILIDGFHQVVPDKMAVHGATTALGNWMVDSEGDVVLIDYGEGVIYPASAPDNEATIERLKEFGPIPLWQNGYYGAWNKRVFLPSEYRDWNSLENLFDFIAPKFEGISREKRLESPHYAFQEAIRALSKEHGSRIVPGTTHNPEPPPTEHFPSPTERNFDMLEALLETPYFEQCFESLTRNGLIDAEIKSRREWLDELKKNKRKEARKRVLAPFLQVIQEIDEKEEGKRDF